MLSNKKCLIGPVVILQLPSLKQDVGESYRTPCGVDKMIHVDKNKK